MRIAVASDGLDVAQHFSQCLNFNYYTTKSYQIVDSQNLPNQGLSAEETARTMRTIDVDALVCGQIAPASAEAFEQHDIEVMTGASGNALQAAQTYLDKKAEELEQEDEAFAEDDEA